MARRRKRSHLSEQLIAITPFEGIRRINLEKSLGPQLRDRCGITEHDDPDTMRTKLSRTLQASISQLNRRSDQRIAGVCFNITDEIELHEMLLCARQDWLAQHLKVTRRTVFNRLRKNIIPEMVRTMWAGGPAADPPSGTR
jgi:hypothetical protein